jgi:hypothetical protein
MNETNQLETEITIMKVFEFMLANNCNRRAACKALGLTYVTFNRKLANNPNLLPDLLKQEKKTLSINLTQLLISQQELLKGLLKDASNPELSVLEKIMLNKHLSELQDKYARGLGVETDQERGAKQFLIGAKLRAGKAKVVETTKTVEFTIGNEPPDNVIDGQLISETSED